VSPWFDAPGGALQFDVRTINPQTGKTYTTRELIDDGYLQLIDAETARALREHPQLGSLLDNGGSLVSTPEGWVLRRAGVDVLVDPRGPRLQQLINEGHGVQRHGAQVTRDQLIDRAVYGKDPITGTTIDGVHGGEHQYAQHATKVTSEPAYVYAENYARSSQQFIDVTNSSTTGRAQVEIPLKDIFGDNFTGNVFGITRQGPKTAPSGYTETVFGQDSTMIVRYKQNSKGDWIFNTMFPQPK